MRAYSMDLRERALLGDAGMKAADVAAKYRVSGSWVRLLKQRRRETGEVAPRVQRHGRRGMLEPHLHTLADLIAAHPDRTRGSLPVTAAIAGAAARRISAARFAQQSPTCFGTSGCDRLREIGCDRRPSKRSQRGAATKGRLHAKCLPWCEGSLEALESGPTLAPAALGERGEPGLGMEGRPPPPAGHRAQNAHQLGGRAPRRTWPPGVSASGAWRRVALRRLARRERTLDQRFVVAGQATTTRSVHFLDHLQNVPARLSRVVLHAL